MTIQGIVSLIKDEGSKAEIARTQVANTIQGISIIAFPSTGLSDARKTVEGYEPISKRSKVVTDQTKTGSTTYSGEGLECVFWDHVRRQYENNKE